MNTSLIAILIHMLTVVVVFGTTLVIPDITDKLPTDIKIHCLMGAV
jgi:hypothetical protein